MGDWIRLMDFSTRIEAEEASALLAKSGILTIVRCDDIGGMRPSLAFAGGASLDVARSDFAAARQIMENLGSDE